MRPEVIDRLRCPYCMGELLQEAFQWKDAERIADGLVWCGSCNEWWPIEDELLELLPRELAYVEDRRRFFDRNAAVIVAKGLEPEQRAREVSANDPRYLQQHHFDWYATNSVQSYSEYQQMPFWRIVDEVTFSEWKSRLQPGGWLLDLGCAQGRSAFPFADLPLQVVGVDISKALVRQAIERANSTPTRAKFTFLVADCSRIPFRSASLDYVLVYGVLHHLPAPQNVCADIARVLKPGGVYFGSENNLSAFRRIFDWLQRVVPLWHEEAGEQPLISARDLRRWFADREMELGFHTHVFVPPHLINLLGYRMGRGVLRWTDRIGQRIPWMRGNGGLVVTTARRL